MSLIAVSNRLLALSGQLSDDDSADIRFLIEFAKSTSERLWKHEDEKENRLLRVLMQEMEKLT